MRNLFWGIVLIVFGFLFLLDNLDIADFGEIIHNYWPLILIIWGASIIMRRQGRDNSSDGTVTQATVEQQFQSDLLHQSNVFGDIFVSASSQNFKGGSVSTVFGDCDVDMSKCAIAEGAHVLRVHSVFGDSTVIVPKDAAIAVEASTVFGDVLAFGQRKQGFSPDIKTATTNYDSASNRMKVVVTKVFGDVKIS